jgi:hypothetical protein
MPLQVLSFLAVAALLLSAWNWRQSRLIEQRLLRLLGGIEEKTLQEALSLYYSRVKKTDSKLSDLLKGLSDLNRIANASAQKTAIVRFNPFGDTGGDQSFALAVLDGHDTGYILTSMHGREGTRIYIKPIEQGQSQYQLSKEERRALETAVNQHHL